MPERAPEVFISFAYQDGLTRAGELQARLRLEGIPSWFEPESMQGGDLWKRQILEALRQDSLRFLLLILTPATLHSAWVPWEWKNARSLGKHVVPVLPEEPGMKPDLKQFPRWIREHDHWKDPSDRDHLIAHLKSPPDHPRPVPFRVPDKPHTYVQREKEYSALRDLLLDQKHENPVAITTAIQGGGGFGKSTLAAALCHDEQIYDAFTDGIVWVDLGPDVGEGKVLAGLRTLYEACTPWPATFTESGDGARQLSEALTNQKTAALIVIDDVWHGWQLEPFLQGGRECARVFTTRKAAIAADVRAAEVPVDEMTQSESIALLRNQLAEEHRGAADDRSLTRLATRVGEMAIMLELVGKQLNDALRRGKPFPEALRFVEKILDSKQIDFFRRDGGVKREDSIARTIEASLDPKFLDQPGDRERALELGVFPAETELPLTTVAAVWQFDDIDDAELVAIRLADLALVKLSATALRMHEVFRRYFFEKYAERSGPAELHGRLVDGWGDLHRLPDVYAWHHLAHHLIEAGRKDRLRELLLDDRWLRAKLRATDPIALRDDAARFPDDRDLRHLARALDQSAHVLAGDPSMLRGQLYGRLMGIESAGIQGLVEQIGQAAEDGLWLRPLRPSLTPADSPLLRVLEGHGGWVRAVAVTPNGRTAVSASDDRTVRVWDLATGNTRVTFYADTAVTSCAVSADGRTFAAGDWSGQVHFLRLEEGAVAEGEPENPGSSAGSLA
jgi:NB-ARC domain/TIR domain/WD domain, G-beta repeat